MKKKYHFIAGLPRSGSTLLTGILNQNPKFHSEISDPLADFFIKVMDHYSREHYFRIICPNDRMKNSLEGFLDGFYAHVNKEVIFNTNRSWPKITECLNEINSDFKIICMVRDYASVLNSFEILYKKRRFVDQFTIYGGNTSDVYSRTNYLAQDSFVRYAYNCLREAYFGPHRKNLLLIEYFDLVSNPEETIERIYDFIKEPKFKHDFNNVVYSFDEYDNAIGANHLHQVTPGIKVKNTQKILPPDLLDQYKNWEFWR